VYYDVYYIKQLRRKFMKEHNIIDQLKTYDDLYYNESSPISDHEYDKLKKDSLEKYSDNEYFKTVGSPVKSSKVDLPHILGSLEKFKTIGEFDGWYKPEKTYIATEKLDGLSIYIKYIDDGLVCAYTRGNGTIGQDITHKARIFCPPAHHNKGILEVRAEIILPGMAYKDLDKKTRRNACAGIINQKGTKHCEKLTIKIYENISSNSITEIERLLELQKFFPKNMLPKLKILKPGALTFKNLTNLLECWKMKCQDIYDIDGLVITENISARENVYYPKKKIAFKQDEKSVCANVIGCVWKTSRLGRIKPVIKIEPIIIQGVEIQNVTAHNFEYIQKEKIGKDSVLEIKRSGDVIPFIAGVNQISEKYFSCDKCPSCDSKTEQIGVDLICKNIYCSAQSLGRITHFFSSMEVEYVSEKTIDTLMQILNLSSIEDFYNLQPENLHGIKGFGTKKITKIINEIEKSKKCKPEHLLSAFGIDGIGKTNSKNILNVYNFDELFDITDLSKIEGIGDITCNNFIIGMKNNKELYEYLKKHGLSFIENDTNNSLNFKFTLTGTGNLKRSEYKKQIESFGGTVCGMSGKTNYLVTNDIDSNSSKTKKAKKLNVDIISYDDLEKILDNQ
jgi:DNA ligase (NAD+)